MPYWQVALVCVGSFAVCFAVTWMLFEIARGR